MGKVPFGEGAFKILRSDISEKQLQNVRFWPKADLHSDDNVFT
jgi:hypothetical protein